MLTVAGCSSTERLKSAAAEQGRISAGINLPDLPADCAAHESHAAIAVGAELRSILVKERAALNRANSRVDRCALFYGETKRAFEAKP